MSLVLISNEQIVSSYSMERNISSLSFDFTRPCGISVTSCVLGNLRRFLVQTIL